MCGLCIEAVAFDMVLEPLKEKGELDIEGLDSFLFDFYLQEAEDPLTALNQMERYAEANGSDLTQLVAPNILLCRLIDILLARGFRSSEYQIILNSSTYREILRKAFSGPERKAFSKGATRFGISRQVLLYDEGNFTSETLSEDLFRPEPNVWEAGEVLSRYMEWWLEGGDVQKNDLHKRMEETGVLDPIEDISETDRSEFDMLFRAFWYSVNLLGSHQEEKDLLWKIVSTDPAGLPHFDGKDLWLQRRAALLLYEMEGLDPFLTGLNEFRPSLLRYLTLKKGFSAGERIRIFHRAKKFSPGEIRDDFFDIKEWVGKN